MSRKNVTQGIDILFSFDATGSMYPCLAEVRRKLRELIERLFSTVPNLRVGIIAHGDYCDEGRTYVLKMLDLTSNLAAITSFVTAVGKTDGGDREECYELVLHKARSASWTANKSRVLVLIGDDVPHGASYPQNLKRLCWRNEAQMLKESGIQVYAVQCLNFRHADSFYRELADLTNGLHLRLDQFRHVERLLLGVAYKQDSAEALAAYEEEVRQHGAFGFSVEEIFSTLAGRKAKSRAKRRDGLLPVDPSRFQAFTVEGTPALREFVESMGITFVKGRSFYPHISRTETIQENKEVILEDDRTGEMFTGAQAREMIGLPYGQRGRVRPNPLPGFTVWVQSTSYNRRLREKRFLYEVPEKAE